jgi:hypothetical protein
MRSYAPRPQQTQVEYRGNPRPAVVGAVNRIDKLRRNVIRFECVVRAWGEWGARDGVERRGAGG